jgi:hypothetical protein
MNRTNILAGDDIGVVLRDPGSRLQREIKEALQQQGKKLMLVKPRRKPCCANENRSMAGGCLNCGDPSY